MKKGGSNKDDKARIIKKKREFTIKKYCPFKFVPFFGNFSPKGEQKSWLIPTNVNFFIKT